MRKLRGILFGVKMKVLVVFLLLGLIAYIIEWLSRGIVGRIILAFFGIIIVSYFYCFFLFIGGFFVSTTPSIKKHIKKHPWLFSFLIPFYFLGIIFLCHYFKEYN